jgi:uncharacterized protein YndB with AHSA1/START domain
MARDMAFLLPLEREASETLHRPRRTARTSLGSRRRWPSRTHQVAFRPVLRVLSLATRRLHVSDRIEKTVELRAPVSRVWRALTDVQEFNRWFRAALEGTFAPGARVDGHSTYPGHEDARFDIVVERMEPERLFAFTWPHGPEPGGARTLVEFRLEPTTTGTRLTVSESGFDGLPAVLRDQAFRDNAGGWAIQLANITEHLAHAGA